MKKLFTLSIALTITIVSFAQKGKVISALNFKEEGKLDKAISIIESTIAPENEKSATSINWPHTWEARGEIFQAIYKTEDENFKSLSEDPLKEAFISYTKALELDTKNKFTNSLKIKFTLLSNDFQVQGAQCYNSGNYIKALVSFEKILEINQLPIFSTENSANIDTAIIYNSGMAALKSGEFDKATNYLKEAANYGYNGPTTFLLLSQVSLEKKDSTAALESLKQGFEKYPEDNILLSNLIQFYLNINKNEEAMHFLEMAIEREPEKAVFYLAKGNLFDKTNDTENAVIFYKKAIELDPDLFMAYFNLGVIYYNEGVKLLERANNIPANDNASYEKIVKEADEVWAKSLPYMEKCYKMQPDDAATIESLKSLYYRLNQMEKYDALQKSSNQ